MASTEALRLFLQANQLWFVEGCTNRALTLYQEAVNRNPADPVVLYQFAHALWALERFDEARELLARADQYRDRLSDRGQELLTAEMQKFSQPPSFRIPLPLPALEFDAERLDELEISADQWLPIASVAAEREMFGLAAQAYRRSGGGFRIHELDEDEREIERKADSALNRLYVMRLRPEQENIDALVSHPETLKLDTVSPPTPTRDQVASTPTKPFSRSQIPLFSCPLVVEISINPLMSTVDDPLSLDIALINRSSQPLGVNQRLLFNHPSSPPESGEVYLSVEGPPGYENRVAYQVRAGVPSSEHFDLLLPGQRVSKHYLLSKYESFHLPGIYQVWVIYRNTIHASVKGLPLLVGSVSSAPISIRRNPR